MTQRVRGKNMPAEERFWQYVDKTPDCWLWTSSLTVKGYGKFHYQGKPRWAHRMAWLFAFGAIPDGLMVCHHCDNPRCVRASHLFLGSPADNSEDMVRKGRVARGFKKGIRRSLTPTQVVQIRIRLKSGDRKADLARQYGVPPNTIRLIAKHQSYTWVSSDQKGGAHVS